jgi:hypothetical protein
VDSSENMTFSHCVRGPLEVFLTKGKPLLRHLFGQQRLFGLQPWPASSALSTAASESSALKCY